jgi:hypothetical protein
MLHSPSPLSPIQRIFRDLSDEEVADIEMASFLSRFRWSGGLGWEEVLKSWRVLIVSEGGAGKTYECRAQRDRLVGAGEAVFVLELATLAGSSVRDMLDFEEEKRFDEWLRSQSEVATFFLVSIDELTAGFRVHFQIDRSPRDCASDVSLLRLGPGREGSAAAADLLRQTTQSRPRFRERCSLGREPPAAPAMGRSARRPRVDRRCVVQQEWLSRRSDHKRGRMLEKGGGRRFVAQTSIPVPYKVYWQIVKPASSPRAARPSRCYIA